MKLLIYIAIAWNIITFAMFGIDKYKAIKGKWRISERTLILSSFMMGGIGAMLGMNIFRHKTKHIKFKILIPVSVIVNILIVYSIWHAIVIE